MRDKRNTTQRQGQRANFTGANSGRASQLASLTGIERLAYLTDDEAAQLIEFMNYLDGLAADDGFKAGWAAFQEYTSDMHRLMYSPCVSRKH